MDFNIEFKVRHYGEPSKWEDIEVSSVALLSSAGSADAVAAATLNDDPTICEVRWNVVGSLQGHYVSRPIDGAEERV